MIPELSPMTIPTKILPKNRGINDKSKHWTIILKIAQKSKIIIKYRCVILVSNFSIKNEPKYGK